jgi:hypothetical protein
MTDDEALAEARRRWGDSAKVRNDTKRASWGARPYAVGVLEIRAFFLYGEGDSWEEALRDAERKLPPTPGHAPPFSVVPGAIMSDPYARMGLPYPTADASADRLKRAGWSAADSALRRPSGIVWVVFAERGDQMIEGMGATQAEAWHRACLRAEAIGPGEW